MNSTIQLYDATLRDGMGGGGMSLTAQEKLRVVERLDALGVDAQPEALGTSFWSTIAEAP